MDAERLRKNKYTVHVYKQGLSSQGLQVELKAGTGVLSIQPEMSVHYPLCVLTAHLIFGHSVMDPGQYLVVQLWKLHPRLSFLKGKLEAEATMSFADASDNVSPNESTFNHL